MVVISSPLSIPIAGRCLPQPFTCPEAVLDSPATGEVLPTIVPMAGPDVPIAERTINP
jgi:hypothetical protein